MKHCINFDDPRLPPWFCHAERQRGYREASS